MDDRSRAKQSEGGHALALFGQKYLLTGTKVQILTQKPILLASMAALFASIADRSGAMQYSVYLLY